MSYIAKLSFCFVSALLVSTLVGCGSKPAAQKPATPNANQTGAQASEDEQVAAALAKFSVEDRALIEKQGVCPVSGERLGVPPMTPKKIEVKGRAVFICCESCEQSLLDEPDKYLAKLGMAADATPVGK